MDKGIDPKSRVQNRPRTERQRFLNIIYFMDSHRTHTLKFTVRSAGITVGVLALLLAWSFVASGLLIHEYQVNSDLRQRARSLLSTIFTYQTRYDEVYEKAYPGKESQPLLTSSDLSTQDTDRATSEPDVKDPVSEKESAALATAAQPEAEAEASASSAASAPKEKIVSQSLEEKLQKLDFPILIENFSTHLQGNTLVARFALKNTKSPNKASGTVLATAKFVDAQQKASFIAMEVSKASSDGGAGDETESSSDQHYNIRYYKNKKFSFLKPQGQTGDFVSITITLKDDAGRKKDYSFPVSKLSEYQPAQETKEEGAGPYAKSVPEDD